MVMVSPIMMMLLLRASAFMNTSSRWALEMKGLIVKAPKMSQCPQLPVGIHSYSSLLISENMADKALARGLVSWCCCLG